MKIAYYRDTDSLYIDLADRVSVETKEISEGVNLDYDERGAVVGIDIDLASQKLDLQTVILDNFPRETRFLQTLHKQ
jgi:uncharacterized protein YuzE